MYTAYETRASSGSTDNSPVVEKIISLRQEQAQLAGYNNAADYLMSNKVRASFHGNSRNWDMQSTLARQSLRPTTSNWM